MTTPKPTPAALDSAVASLSDQKVSVAQAIYSAFVPTVTSSDATAVVKVPKMTKAQLEALDRLPQVYGKVTPAVPRALTKDEATALVEERQVIDVLLSLLKTRKDTSIREAIANHLDTLVDDPKTKKDDKGHYLAKADVPVEGTEQKFQRTVSSPKPDVSSQLLLDLFEQGDLTRAEYLSLTVVPDVRRVFDESKARKAIKENPALMAKVAKATVKGAPIGTIKVAKA